MGKETKKSVNEAQSFFDTDINVIRDSFDCLYEQFAEKAKIIARSVKNCTEVKETLDNFDATLTHINIIKAKVSRMYAYSNIDIVTLKLGNFPYGYNVNNTFEYIEFLEHLVDIKNQQSNKWIAVYNDIEYVVTKDGKIPGLTIKWESKVNELMKQIVGF